MREENKKYLLKNLILYLGSQSISKIGSSILDFVIIWTMVLYNENSNPFIISMIVTYVPKILVTYFLNEVKLNKSQKVIMNIGDLVTALFSMILVYVSLDNLYVVYVIIFMRSIGTGIMEPYSNSIIVMLFDDEAYYKKVNALNNFIKSITSLIIPVISALILKYLTIKYVAIIDVVTALISCLMVYNLEIIKEKKEISYAEKIKLSILGKKMLLINFIFYFLMTIPGFMTALLVKYYFGENIDYLKYNEIFWTLGMILGSYIIIKIKFNNKNLFSYAIILFGVTITILSISSNILIYLLIIFISGITFPAYSTSNKLLIQKNMTEKENEYYFLKESSYTNIAIPISMVVAGYILNYINIDIVFTMSGVLIILLGLYSYRTIFKMKNIKI